MDSAKVIKGLDVCQHFSEREECPEDCPYFEIGIGNHDCMPVLMADALALLEMAYINTREEPHPIEVGEDGLPY